MRTGPRWSPLAEGLPPVQAPREVPAVAAKRHPQPLTASRLVEAPTPPPALLLAAVGPPGPPGLRGGGGSRDCDEGDAGGRAGTGCGAGAASAVVVAGTSRASGA